VTSLRSCWRTGHGHDGGAAGRSPTRWLHIREYRPARFEAAVASPSVAAGTGWVTRPAQRTCARPTIANPAVCSPCQHACIDQWAQPGGGVSMRAASKQTTPDPGTESRYGPTPAAPGGGADRPIPARVASGEVHRWPPGHTVDRPHAQPTTTPPEPATSGAQAPTGDPLARLPEMLTVKEVAAVLRVGSQPALPGSRTRRAPRGPSRPHHPHPQDGPVGPSHHPTRQARRDGLAGVTPGRRAG
jgi:hypothetical protein